MRNITWMAALYQIWGRYLISELGWGGDINRTFPQLQLLRGAPKLPLYCLAKSAQHTSFKLFHLSFFYFNSKSLIFILSKGYRREMDSHAQLQLPGHTRQVRKKKKKTELQIFSAFCWINVQAVLFLLYLCNNFIFWPKRLFSNSQLLL